MYGSLSNLQTTDPTQMGMMMDSAGMAPKSQSLNNLQTVAEVEPAGNADEKLSTDPKGKTSNLLYCYGKMSLAETAIKTNISMGLNINYN